MLAAGAKRVILGTAAAADPTFVRRAVEEHAEAIVVAVDVRGGRVMVQGWQEVGPALEEAIPALDDAGAPRYLVTSIARDGTLKGPDDALRRHTAPDRHADHRERCVRDADDVWTLRDLGCEAVVTGKALYERTLKLAQVIRDEGVTLAKRIVPCLDVDGGRVVKGTRFQAPATPATSVELAAHYDREGATS